MVILYMLNSVAVVILLRLEIELGLLHASDMGSEGSVGNLG